MSEQNETDNLLNISVLPPEVVKEAYKDLAQPAARNIGSFLGTLTGVLNSVTTRLNHWNHKQKLIFEHNIRKLEIELGKIDEEKRIEIPLELFVPIIEKMSYTSNSEINEMYVNLLAKGASKETVALAHPGFIHSISCLSYDEALILNYLYKNNKFVIPAVNIIVDSIRSLNGRFISDLTYTALSDMCELNFPENVNLYIHNLTGLGILEKIEGRMETNEEKAYVELEASLESEKDFFFESMTKENNLDPTLYETGFVRGLYFITDFGQKFLRACNEVGD